MHMKTPLIGSEGILPRGGGVGLMERGNVAEGGRINGTVNGNPIWQGAALMSERAATKPAFAPSLERHHCCFTAPAALSPRSFAQSIEIC